MQWRADAKHRAGRRLAEALGFSLEGVLRKHSITPSGANRDVALYALLNSDWAEGGAAARARAFVARRTPDDYVTKKSKLQPQRVAGGGGGGAAKATPPSA